MGCKWLHSLLAFVPRISVSNISVFTIRAAFVALLCVLQACSQSTDDRLTNTNKPTAQSSAMPQSSEAKLSVLDVAFVDSGVLAPLAVYANEQIVSVNWRQLVGPSTTIINSDQTSAWVLMPFTADDVQVPMLFGVDVTLASGEQFSAEQRIMLMPMTPQVVIAERWLTTQNAVVNFSANFQHAVFGSAGAGSSSGGGQLPPDPNTPPINTTVTLPLVWRTAASTLAEVLPNPPHEVTFNASRQAQLALPLGLAPVPDGSEVAAEVMTLQFDIVLPTGERLPISVFVRRPVNVQASSASSQAAASSENVTGNTSTSEAVFESSSSEAVTSQAISSASSQMTVASSDVGVISSEASSLLSSSVQSSEPASSSASSVSSTSNARELAVTKICDSAWQGLGDLPVAHNNYQTESPYINAEPFVDPVYVGHIEQSQALVSDDAALVAAMEMLKSQPTGIWLDTAASLCQSIAGKPSLVDYLNLAEARQQLLTLVLYNIPARDCVRQERAGDFEATEQGLVDYQRFVDRFAALAVLYPAVSIAAVLEPTAFASTVSNGGVVRTGCYEARQLQIHERALDYGLKRLAGAANIFTFLDYGDPAWPGSYNGDQALLEILASSQLADDSLAIEGLSLNVGSYVPLDEPYMLAQDNSGAPYTLPKGAHSVNAHREFLSGVLREQAAIELPMLVDTGRNGWGGELRPSGQAIGQEMRIDRRGYRDAWCNVLDAGLGVRPSDDVTLDYLWINPPNVSLGDSSVACDSSAQASRYRMKSDAPPAGEWFHNYFVDLIQNAYPPLISPAMPPQILPLEVSVSPTQIPVQSAEHVQVTLQLPSNVSFTSLSLSYAGEELALVDNWLGQSAAAFSLEAIPLTYFHDLLKITAQGSDSNIYYLEVALFNSPEFDGKPIIDIALGGRGFFPDFYQLYQAELPEYVYTNNGFEGDDFLWISNESPFAIGEAGDDYIQVGESYGGSGDDVLASWRYSLGGSGNDRFYAWGQSVVVEDDENDRDVVYWLGRDFTEINSEDNYHFAANGEDLIATENLGGGANEGVLTIKGFFANPPHINELHYGDGLILTPETAREMLGLDVQ